ncbi:hypothetical protein H4Q26_002707 [Puccinia striiformis f. sp. tritici PST-130]|nr:hypothetical protein H4Q26_002707 [Puccinia striiformis f. sp. tritici PST-130]
MITFTRGLRASTQSITRYQAQAHKSFGTSISSQAAAVSPKNESSAQTGVFKGHKLPDQTYKVTLIPGDGIGPEISESVKAIYKAAKVPITWEERDVTPVIVDGKSTIPKMQLIRFINYRSSKRPCRLSGILGIEHEVVDGVVQSIKLITMDASERVARYAFQYARTSKRPHVTAVHKASIMKMSDGMFLQACRKVKQYYPDIKYDEDILDRVCLRIVQNPAPYSDRVMDAKRTSEEMHQFFEAVHGSAPDIAGTSKANPTALLLSSLMMLRHMNLPQTLITIAEVNISLVDLGGKASTQQYTEAILKRL